QPARRRPCGARFDVLRGGIERFAGGDDVASLVILEERDEVWLRGHLDAMGLRRRNEHAAGAIAWLEVLRRHPPRIVHAHFAEAVAVEEEQPPVAHADPLAELEADAIRRIERQS